MYQGEHPAFAGLAPQRVRPADLLVNYSRMVGSETVKPEVFQRIKKAVEATRNLANQSFRRLWRQMYLADMGAEQSHDIPLAEDAPYMPIDVRQSNIVIATLRFHTEGDNRAVDEKVIRFLEENPQEPEKGKQLIHHRLPVEYEDELRDFGGVRLVAWRMHLPAEKDPETDGVMVKIPLFRGTGKIAAYFPLLMSEKQVQTLDETLATCN